MFGCYASIADLKGILGVTSTTDDTVMRKMLEAASRSIDRYTNRFFHTLTETKYFDGAKTLWIPDLLSITTLKTDEDGDGTFENTFQVATIPVDYLLYGAGGDDALNLYPRIRIEINPDGDYGSFASGVKKGVEIAGLWGYGDGQHSRQIGGGDFQQHPDHLHRPRGLHRSRRCDAGPAGAQGGGPGDFRDCLGGP